jgi:predicted PurR-regulated permease PerM
MVSAGHSRTPALMGKAERMNALAQFLGLLLWTWLWGAWGTILAVPMLAVIKSHRALQAGRPIDGPVTSVPH